MDLSTYYEEFQFTYNLAIVALCLAFFVVIFVGVRSIRDKKESLKKKIANCVLLLLIFASVLIQFLLGPSLAKKDIEEKTIYCYEGVFEITEISYGIYYKATFLIDEQEITLKYSKDEPEYDSIKLGKYEGKLIYAHHLAQVLCLEMHNLQFAE